MQALLIMAGHAAATGCATRGAVLSEPGRGLRWMRASRWLVLAGYQPVPRARACAGAHLCRLGPAESIVLRCVPPQRPEGSVHSGSVCAREFDRLTFLLRVSAQRRGGDDGSPMDVSPSPFLGACSPQSPPTFAGHPLGKNGFCQSGGPHVTGKPQVSHPAGGGKEWLPCCGLCALGSRGKERQVDCARRWCATTRSSRPPLTGVHDMPRAAEGELSGHVPLFNGEAAQQPKSNLSAVAEWLSDSIIDEPEITGTPGLIFW